MGNEAEDTTNNAWYDCATNGSSKECQGEQRVCLTEERRRNEVTTEVITMCKAPEACAYLWRRNDKFNQRSNQGSTTLLEQADVLSSEDTDFHDNRADSDKDTDITWGGR